MSSEEGLKVKCVLRCGRVGGGGGRVNCLAGNTKGRERESPGPLLGGTCSPAWPIVTML